MSQRLSARSRLIVLGAVALLGGCAQVPPEVDLTNGSTPDRFARLSDLESLNGQLEHNFLQHCSLANDRAQVQFVALNTALGELERIQGEMRALKNENAVTRQCPPQRDNPIGDKEILGEIEWVDLPSLGTALKARVDTGATSSSLTAHEITYFERDGEDWVRFQLALNDEDEVAEHLHGVWLEAPVVRRVRIIQASGAESRPVIRLPMKLGPIEQMVDFTLSDRSELTYPVLLGRRTLLDLAVVDVSQRYLHPRSRYPDDVTPSIAARNQNAAPQTEDGKKNQD